jgi:uncharacterized protein (DUF2267 family)
MDQIVDLVSEKAGISKDQAKTAVDTVLDFIKERLPAPLSGQLESLLEGADNMDLDKGKDLLGGLFGKK